MEALTNVFKVLSDETRLRIVLLLYQEDLCVCQLSGILNTAQPKISKNLAKLRDMGFVTDERREKFVYYGLKRDHAFLMATLSSIFEHRAECELLQQDLEKLKFKAQFLNQCALSVASLS